MSLEQALENYRQLRAKVDAKFAEIHGRYPQAFQCRQGCHSCCQPGLSVSPVERAEIMRLIASDPGLRERLEKLAGENPFQGTRCQMLTADGSCAIYEVRPLICRSHGAPIAFRADEAEDDDDDPPQLRDVCPLNFAVEGIANLPPGDLLNIDTVNAILAVVNQTWLKNAQAATRRFTLTLAGLTSDDPGKTT